MKLIGNAVVLLMFSLLFLLIWPVGLLIRLLHDPLRLRRGRCDTYLRKAESTDSAPYSTADIDKTRPGFARKV